MLTAACPASFCAQNCLHAEKVAGLVQKVKLARLQSAVSTVITENQNDDEKRMLCERAESKKGSLEFKRSQDGTWQCTLFLVQSGFMTSLLPLLLKS